MIPREIFVQNLRGLLAPVRQFLDDPSVTEIMVNGPNEIYVERQGRLVETDARFPNEDALLSALRSLLRLLLTGRFLSRDFLFVHAVGEQVDAVRVDALLGAVVAVDAKLLAAARRLGGRLRQHHARGKNRQCKDRQ